MNSTVLKMEPDAKKELSVVATSTKKTWLRKAFCKIESVFGQTMRPSEDLETWRRLEFRNDFRNEQNHRRNSWRL